MVLSVATSILYQLIRMQRGNLGESLLSPGAPPTLNNPLSLTLHLISTLPMTYEFKLTPMVISAGFPRELLEQGKRP